MKGKKWYLIIIGLLIIFLVIFFVLRIIHNESKDNFNNVIIDKEEIQVMNSRFTGYEGTNVSGASVKALVTGISSNNKSYSERKISINSSSVGGGVSADAGEQAFNDYMNKLNPRGLYTVVCLYDEKTGFINSVLITEDKSP